MEKTEKSELPLISYYQDDSPPEAQPLIECSCDLQPTDRLQIILFSVIVIATLGGLFFGLTYLAKKLGWM